MTTPTGAPLAVHHRTILLTLRGVLIVVPWVVHLFFTDLLLSLLAPLAFAAPSAAYHVSSRLAYVVWRWIQLIFTRINAARITVSGAALPRHESAIVIANHVSWTDFYLVQHLAIQTGMLGRCRWFAKQQLKWVPVLGWGLWAMGMPLVSRSWNQDRKELDRVFQGPKTFRWPVWLITYSEATRYTPQRYLESVQWCKANNMPIPRYTLHPRTRGFVTTVKELSKSSSVTAIYDLTLVYAHDDIFLEAPTIWETLSQPRLDRNWRFHVHVDRFSIEELVNKSDRELAAWLEWRWVAKSRRLERLKHDLEKGVDWGTVGFSEQKERRERKERKKE